ncbi:MAG: hypothetical protein V2I45_12385 [Halieaceae bacterium]|jgi:hypothetical protein|nr:hypothetical protein [Halieaceae bacterium]
MKFLQRMLVGLTLISGASLSWGQGQTVTFQFTQTGFSNGASISGYFRGTDLDGDGRIYAVSRTISDIFELPFGNELDYAQVTFNGFGDLPGATTVVYDRLVADMESPANTFMALAYNLDGGAFGDDPNEGVSLSVFSPSTNYNMGNAFSFIFSNEASQTIGACDGSSAPCGLVISLVPDQNSPIGAAVTFEDFSSEPVQRVSRSAQPVPVPTEFSIAIGLAIALLGSVYLRRRRGSYFA